MSELPLYPRVLHFCDSHATPDDLVMNAEQEREVLAAEIVVREKLDGINVAIGKTGRRRLTFCLRGPWAESLDGTIGRSVDIYVRQRRDHLLALLKPGEVLYGEWLWHRLSITYRALPDTYSCFGLRRRDGRFESYLAYERRIRRSGLTWQPSIWRGRLGSVARLRELIGPSQFGAPRMEGLIVERVRPGPALRFAKWVEPGFEKAYAEDLSGARNRVLK